jgi:hypothetical protein
MASAKYTCMRFGCCAAGKLDLLLQGTKRVKNPVAIHM